MDKNSLEQLLSSYNWWMGLSTIAVAVGILGEYVAHFIFEKDARDNKREMAVSISFGILVLGGVVGEYIFGSKLSQVSEKLQQVADIEVSQSNKDAVQARRDAAEANRQAGIASERAGQLEKEAAGLRKQEAELRKQNLNTETELENERTARVAYEAKNASRRLSSKQQSLLRERAATFRIWKITIAGFNTPEASDFATDFNRTFSASGFQVEGSSDNIAFGGRGLQIQCGPRRAGDLRILISALHEIGAINDDPLVRTVPNPPDLLELDVYPKP